MKRKRRRDQERRFLREGVTVKGRTQMCLTMERN